MRTTQWEGTLTALSSIAHGGETRGTITLLRRELVFFRTRHIALMACDTSQLPQSIFRQFLHLADDDIEAFHGRQRLTNHCFACRDLPGARVAPDEGEESWIRDGLHGDGVLRSEVFLRCDACSSPDAGQPLNKAPSAKCAGGMGKCRFGMISHGRRLYPFLAGFRPSLSFTSFVTFLSHVWREAKVE